MSGRVLAATSCWYILMVVISVGHGCPSAVKKAIVLPSPQPIGCYKDEILNRDFTEYGGLRLNKMRVEVCQKLCNPLETKYMGLQGDECWCGNAFGKHGKAQSSDCNHVCSGSMSEYCGGDGFNSVYDIDPS